MPIEHGLLTEIIEFLCPLPDFQDEPSRKALLIKAGIDLSKFNFNEPPKNFLPALLHHLNNSGFEEKIVTILQKIDVGGKLREKADNFIQRLQTHVKKKKPSNKRNSKTQKIEIHLRGDFQSFSAERRSAAIDAFAGVLGISSKTIKIYQFYEGSIILQLGIPTQATQKLTHLLESNSSQLHKLKIKKVIFYFDEGENKIYNLPQRVLFISSNPNDTPRLFLDKEIREIEDVLSRSKYRDDFQIIQKHAARINDLRQSLLDHTPHILHFAGHGTKDGILLEDVKGNAISIDPTGFAKLLGCFKEQIECVILNVCDSEYIADEVVQYIPYVIAMNSSIKDNNARDFSVGFYDALGAGKSYRDAFVIGKAAIQMTGSREYLYPVFKENPLPENNAQDDPSFVNRKEELSKFSTIPLPENNVQDDPSFVNRKEELSKFSTIPYLIIDAPSQYGKTELLKKLQSQSKSDDTYCVYIELPDGCGKNDVLCQILRKLQKCQNKPEMICHGKPCLQKNVLSEISTSLLFNMKAAQKRISLYIDRADRLPENDIRELFEEFFLQISQYIFNFNAEIWLQIIVAGRYISRWKEKIKELPFQVSFLSPFDFKAVKEMVASYDAPNPMNRPPKYQQNFAALLLYLTGGHPGLMLFILKQYYGLSITPVLRDELAIYHAQQFIELFKKLKNETPDLPFKELSIFRRYTIELLRKIIAAQMIPFDGEAEDLERQLRFSRLVHRTDDGFIQDDIVRRVFAIRLRNEKGEAAFATLCQRAKEIYKTHLLESAHAPHIVATEILFEEILRLYYSSSQKQILSERYNAFFSKEGELENCLQILLQKATKDDDTISQFYQMLKAEQDWEFKFTVNFFLRQTDDYTDEPYQTLLKYVECFMREHKLS